MVTIETQLLLQFRLDIRNTLGILLVLRTATQLVGKGQNLCQELLLIISAKASKLN